MIYKRTTDPTELAVSVADMKSYLRLSVATHDTLVQTLIEAAQRMLEARANIMLKTQTWDLSLSQSEVVKEVYMAKYPILGFSSITYYDDDNVLQSLTNSNNDYISFINGRPGSLIFDSVPSVYDRPDAMKITFLGGYQTVPDDIVLGIKMMVWRMYKHPDDPVTEKMSFVDKIVRDHRSWQP